MGAEVDRAYPRTTCARCHKSQFFERTAEAKPARLETPSCASCHVQHIKDVHWAASLRVAKAIAPAVSEASK